MIKILFTLFTIVHFLLAIDEVVDKYSNGLPKAIVSYKVVNNQLVLDRERGFYSNGEMKYDRRYRNDEVYSEKSWFKVNLREYYYPIDKLVNDPKIYVYSNIDGELVDIQKLEAIIEENGDTVLVSTFYADLYDQEGTIWKEHCMSKGVRHMSGPNYRMVNSPIFEYHQDIGEYSRASFDRDNINHTVFWERTLKDTLTSNTIQMVVFPEDTSSIFSTLTSRAIIFEDVFSDGKEDIYSRTLRYQKGIGRVSLVDKYQFLELAYIFSLDEFKLFLKEWENW